MTSRNWFMLRSIAFGAFTKVAGSLVLLVGLPVLAHGLSESDYATFLKCMSICSFGTIWLGVTSSLAVRMLALSISSNDLRIVREAEKSVSGLFVLSAIVTACISVVAAVSLIHERIYLPIFAIILTTAGGFFLMADSYRVALRTDHLSNISQMMGSLVLSLGLIFFGRSSVQTAILLYFGVPALAQATTFFYLYRERRFALSLSLDFKAITGHLRDMIPLLISSISDYSRIFGSSLALSFYAPTREYAQYTTVVLLVARLINPISLITRPMMPAFIDALAHNDAKWMAAARKLLCFSVIASFVLGGFLIFILPSNPLQWMFPPHMGSLTGAELCWAALMFWAGVFGALVYPLFIASARAQFYSVVNASFCFTGICVGIKLEGIYGASGMIAAMAIAGLGSTSIFVIYAVSKLLKTDNSQTTILH